MNEPVAAPPPKPEPKPFRILSESEFKQRWDERNRNPEARKSDGPFVQNVEVSGVLSVKFEGPDSSLEILATQVAEAADEASVLLRHFGRERKNPLLTALGHALRLRIPTHY